MKKVLITLLSVMVISSAMFLPAYADNPGGAPSLTIDISGLTAALGGSGGGEVEILDLSWYTPYKQTVDNLISGFLWLGYIWHLFKIAPSILGSVGLSVDKADDIESGKKGGRK